MTTISYSAPATGLLLIQPRQRGFFLVGATAGAFGFLTLRRSSRAKRRAKPLRHDAPATELASVLKRMSPAPSKNSFKTVDHALLCKLASGQRRKSSPSKCDQIRRRSNIALNVPASDILADFPAKSFAKRASNRWIRKAPAEIQCACPDECTPVA